MTKPLKNVLAVYEQMGDTMHWKEQHLYGSSRLGMVLPGVKRYPGDGLDDGPYFIEENKEQPYGARRYEITNHLGNVTTVVSDRKVPIDNGGSITYEAAVHSAMDYYPFGSLMTERTFQAGGYRYGFGGHEQDDEVKGVGNHLSFGDYGYDPRLGRRWKVDPLAEMYSNISPYAYVANNPVIFIDPDGKRIVLPTQSQAMALAADLNRIYQNTYGVNNAFHVQSREVTLSVANPDYKWYNPLTWGNPSTVEKTETRHYIEANQNFDWTTDRYTKGMKEIIDANSDILVQIVDDKGREATQFLRPSRMGLLEGAGGGAVLNSNHVILSNELSETKVGDPRHNSMNWTLGGVALHELLYHIHPMGLDENNRPNIMRNHYQQRTGRPHGAGRNQNRSIRPLEE